MARLIQVTVLLLMLLLAWSSAQANVGRDYGESVRALSRQDWERAEMKIRDALSGSDRPQASIEISGGIRFPYMPWYVLGAALQGQGDCRGAVEAWGRSLEAGVVRDNEREFQTLQSGMQTCQALLAENTATESSPTGPAEAGSGLQPGDGLRNVADRSDGQPAIQAGPASAGPSDSAAADPAGEQRRQALLAQQAEAEQRRTELERRNRLSQSQRELRGELDRVAASADDAFGNDSVIEARVRLVELSHASTGLLESDSVDEIEQHSQMLRQGVRDYDRVVQEWRAEQQAIAYRTPPSELRQLADHYFSGDYRSVAEMADPVKFNDSRQRVQALLFRSAARFNQYWLRGGNDGELLDGARQDIRSIKELNPAFQPYVAAFSPRYLAFFNDA